MAIIEDFQEVAARGVITDGMADGTIRLGVRTVAGALNWIARWYDAEDPSTTQDIADVTVAILTQGLKPRAENG